jgi:hypothetical protein
MVRVGAQGIYISMFDEFNEGNQIAKTAETIASVPTNSGMLALDEDGTACSADYYLRLTADGGRMLKGQIASPAGNRVASSAQRNRASASGHRARRSAPCACPHGFLVRHASACGLRRVAAPWHFLH